MDWGTLITATLRLYQQAGQGTWQKVQRSWWVGFLPLLYSPVLLLSAQFVAPLGLIGGFLLGFVLTLCTSSYLYFLAGVVNGNRVTLSEIGESWRPHFSSVITILFFLSILHYLLALVIPPTSSGLALRTLVNVVLLVILNPIPEIIYQGRSESLDMLQESVEFLRDSGVEWFLPLVLLAAVSFFVLPLALVMMPLELGRLTFPVLSGGSVLGGSLFGLLWAAASAWGLFVLMVFRGLLFRALAGGTRRQRIFRARSA